WPGSRDPVRTSSRVNPASVHESPRSAFMCSDRPSLSKSVVSASVVDGEWVSVLRPLIGTYPPPEPPVAISMVRSRARNLVTAMVPPSGLVGGDHSPPSFLALGAAADADGV